MIPYDLTYIWNLENKNRAHREQMGDDQRRRFGGKAGDGD